MAILHGSWILEKSQGYFFIWGETWRSTSSIKAIIPSEKAVLNPYGMKQEELVSFLGYHSLSLEKFLFPTSSAKNANSNLASDRCKTETFIFPSQIIKKQTKNKPILPILSERELQEDDVSISLHPWQVQGFSLTPLEAIKFLQAVPLNSLSSTNSFIGGGLRFWSQVYRWSLDLLSRCKFLPGLFENEDSFLTYWQPLLDSKVDRDRFQKFTQEMPSVCRAYSQNSHLVEPQELLLSFLSNMIDNQVRKASDASNIPGKETTVYSWLNSLSQEEAVLELPEESFSRLTNVLKNWTTPIQDDLVNPITHQLGQNPYRPCFILEPPSTGELNWGHTDWKLKYSLQAVDNSEFLVPAEEIWNHPVDAFTYNNRVIDTPQEILLKGLGIAGRLYSPIEASLEQPLPSQCKLNSIEVYEFVRARVWQLQDNGFGVVLPSGLAQEEERRLGIKIHAEVSPKKGERLGLNSLLKYKLEVAVGEESLSKAEFERLLDQKSPIVKVNDEWIALQPADVKAAQEILSVSHTPIELSVEDAVRLQTGETKTLAKLPVTNFEATGVLEQFINTITNNQALEPIETPEEFQGELRPYQSLGVSWLAFLEQWGLGACLADDMGLGKTIELIAFLLHLKEKDALANPTLLICPTSVLSNWEREVKKFAPTLSALVHHGDKREKGKSFAKAVKKKDLVITSYPLVYRDLATLKAVEWQGVVLDEAQNVKNPQAKQSQAVREFNPGFRIALTGTPVENRLSELWSILDFLNPNYLGTKQFFQRRFAIPIEKHGDRDSLQILRSLVQPFILRRLKTDKDIIQDLPEKQEMTVFCGLSEEQATLYQKLVDDSLKEIESSEGIKRRGLILTLLLRLKQVCNHPAQYFKEKQLEIARRSGKLLRLVEMLEEVIEEGDRALIFTQFAEWGKLLQPYLEQKFGKETLFFYGGTSKNEREDMIDRFQNDPAGPPLLILSLKAGGTGLNLTRANHVFHVDRWWNPAVENQATDRAFRIGQTRNVQVHKFVCTGTLEERIHELIESKKQLAEQTVDAGEQWITELDTDSLRNLLLLDREAVMDE